PARAPDRMPRPRCGRAPVGTRRSPVPMRKQKVPLPRALLVAAAMTGVLAPAAAAQAAAGDDGGGEPERPAAPVGPEGRRPGGVWVLLPFLFYTPGTGPGGGGAAGRYFRTAPGAEPSGVLAAVTVTAR